MTPVHTYTRTCVQASTMTLGGILPKFVTPYDVRDLKNRIDPFVRALDQSVADCKALPDGMRTGWQGFSQAWRTFFNEDDSWLHTAAQMDQGEAYEVDVARWQEMIGGYKCDPGAPVLIPSTGAGREEATRWQGTIKTVAVAGAVIAAVIGFRAVFR